MLGSNQDQNVGPGATAVQAQRDVVLHQGLTPEQVRDQCALYLHDNFPVLREEARQEAERQVRMLGDLLGKRLTDDAAKIVIEKFAQPGVQATLNDAVMAVGRRGQSASPEVLVTLIAERLSASSTAYRDVVLSEAVLVVPKLTPQQLKLIAFVHFVRYVQFNATTYPALQVLASFVLNDCRGGFDLSDSQKAHIQYSGAGAINSFIGGDIYDQLRAQPSFASAAYPDAEAFKRACLRQMPSYGALLDQFNKEKLMSMTLTSVGQAIAVAQLSKTLPGGMDFGIWIN